MFFYLTSNIVRTIMFRQVHFIIDFSFFNCFNLVFFFSIKFFCICISNFSFFRKTSCFITCQKSNSFRLWMSRMKCVFTMNLNTSFALTKFCYCVLNRVEIVKCNFNRFMIDISKLFTKSFDNCESTSCESRDSTFWFFLCLK